MKFEEEMLELTHEDLELAFKIDSIVDSVFDREPKDSDMTLKSEDLAMQ